MEVPHPEGTGLPSGLCPGNYFWHSAPAAWASFSQGFRLGRLLVQKQASIKMGRAVSVLPNTWKKQRLGSKKGLNWGVGWRWETLRDILEGLSNRRRTKLQPWHCSNSTAVRTNRAALSTWAVCPWSSGDFTHAVQLESARLPTHSPFLLENGKPPQQGLRSFGLFLFLPKFLS